MSEKKGKAPKAEPERKCMLCQWPHGDVPVVGVRVGEVQDYKPDFGWDKTPGPPYYRKGGGLMAPVCEVCLEACMSAMPRKQQMAMMACWLDHKNDLDHGPIHESLKAYFQWWGSTLQSLTEKARWRLAERVLGVKLRTEARIEFP